MEYNGIWIVFLTLWLHLGAGVAVYLVAAARLLKREHDLPPPRLLTAWRVIGVMVAVGSVAKLLDTEALDKLSNLGAGKGDGTYSRC